MTETQSSPSPSLFVKVRSGSPPNELRLEYLGYPSAEAFDLAAGQTGSCLDLAQRWIIHRDTNVEFDQKFAPWIESFTGIPRPIDDKRTAKAREGSPNPDGVKPLKVKFNTYLNLVFSKVDEAKADQIKVEALRLSRTIQVNASPASRAPAIEPMFFRRAESILSQELSLIDQKVSAYLSLVPNFPLVRDDHGKPILESLARLMKEFTEKQLACED